MVRPTYYLLLQNPSDVKKLLLFWIAVSATLLSLSQGTPFPSYSQVGSNTSILDNKGAGQFRKGIVNGVYTDTTAANLDHIDFYPGAQIFTSVGNAIWVRDSVAHRWLVQGGFITNSVTNISIINQVDSSITIQYCTALGACDTVTLITNITNGTEVSFRDDTTIIVCNQAGECDTLDIPQQQLYVFQNGIGSPFPGIVELGFPLVRPTIIDQNGNKMSFIDGTVQIADGTQGAGKVFTSDIDGNGTWQTFSDPLIDGVVDGMIVTWDSLLTFDVSAGHFNKGGVQYAVPFTVITLDTLVGSDPRADAFIATIFPGLGIGTDSSLTGIPDQNPLVPATDPIEQQILTSVTINPGENVPSGILATNIYDENVEWTTAAGAGQTANFDDTAFPIHLTKDANVSAIASNRYIQFTNSSTIDLNNYFALKLYIRNKSVMANNVRLTFRWMNGNTFITTNVVALGGNAAPFNYSRTTINAYQVITIPIPAFVNTSTVVDRLRITFTGTNAQGFYLDWVQLQGGFTQGGGGNPTGVTSVAMTGNIVFTPIVTNPTTTVSIANPLANAAANTFLGNQTSSSAPPTYSAIDLSQNANFANTLNPVLITASPTDGAILTSQSGVTQWTVLPSGYDTTFVLPPLFVLRGVSRDTVGIHLIAGTNITLDSNANGTTINSTASGISGITAEQGLTANTSTNVRLGGTLNVGNATIATGGNNLTISTVTAAVNPFAVTSTSGAAISATATTGNAIVSNTTSGQGLRATSTNSSAVYGATTNGLGGEFTRENSNTASVNAVVSIQNSSSSTAANGLGGKIVFNNETSDGSIQASGEFHSKWTDVTVGTRTGSIELWTTNSAVLARKFAISGAGLLTLDAYGAGTLTSDGSGNITSVSDERLKNINGFYDGGLDQIMKIRPIVYHWNAASRMETEHPYIGFSAQNIQFALGDNAVGRNAEGYMSVQDRAIMAAMIVAIQELKAEVDRLKKRQTKY